MRRRLLLAGLLLALASPVSAALGVEVLPAPRAHAGATEVALGGGTRLVRRVADPQDVLSGARFTLEGGGATGGFSAPVGDVSEAWRVFRGPDRMLLVADRVWTSNGMGVERWVLTAFRLGQGAVRPVRLTAADWGPDGVAVRQGRLAVLATDWVWPADGSGAMQFLGAWCALEPERLGRPSPWLARPFVFSFERERAQGMRPSYWLRPGKAGPYPGGDPRLGPETAPRAIGRLAHLEPDGDGLRLDLISDAGVTRPLWLAGWGDAPPGRRRVAQIGEQGRLWPAGYLPADPRREWEGAGAALATYGDQQVLWLLP